MRRNSSRSKARKARAYAAICYTGIAVQLIAVSIGALVAFSTFPN